MANNETEVELETVNSKSVSSKSCPTKGVTCFKGYSKRERYLTLGSVTLLSVVIGMSFVIACISTRTNPATYYEKDELLASVEGETPHAENLFWTRSRRPFRPWTPISKTCLTQGCVVAASNLIQRLNESVDPCDDFFEFACGNFIKNTVIPDEKSHMTMLTKLGDDLTANLRVVIEERVNEKDSKSTVMAKDFYASCMDRGKIEETGLDILLQVLSDYGGWPVLEGTAWDEGNFSWIEALYTNRKQGFSINSLFSLLVDIDIENSTRRMLWVDKADFGVSREFLVEGIEDAAVRANFEYAADVAELLGANRSVAVTEMKDVFDFIIQLAKLSMAREERRNLTKIVNLKSLSDMTSFVPEIPWIEYISRMLPESINVDETEVINVADPSYVQNALKVIQQTPKRVLANYMIWRNILDAATYLTEDIRALEFRYIQKLSGTSTRTSRWEECVSLVNDNLGYAVGNLYIKKYFDEEGKAQVEELVQYLRKTFDDILKSVKWMDRKTREEALKKSKAMVPHLAYPEELLDDDILNAFYSDVEIGRNQSLFENMQEIALFLSNYSFSILREPVNKSDWKERPSVAQANAYYNFLQNTLEFPAGILQGHFFGQDRPKYMNFGAIGLVIGHEITHGFDDLGKQFDAQGNLRNWWEPRTEESFRSRADCIVEQYSSYVAPENGMRISGINTQGENIADNGGVKEAYLAYQNWVLNNGIEDKLPGLKYTPNQLFWITSGQVWCSKYRPEYLKGIILTDDHSPGRFRIIGPFSNSEEFERDFRCSFGSKMNPRRKCVVW